MFTLSRILLGTIAIGELRSLLETFGDIQKVVPPVFRYHDLGLQPRVLLQKIEEVRTFQQLKRLARCKIKGCLPVATRCHEDTRPLATQLSFQRAPFRVGPAT